MVLYEKSNMVFYGMYGLVWPYAAMHNSCTCFETPSSGGQIFSHKQRGNKHVKQQEDEYFFTVGVQSFALMEGTTF